MKKLIKQPIESKEPNDETKEPDESIEDDDKSFKTISFKKRNIPNLSNFDISKVNDLKNKLDSMKMENNQHDFSQSIHSVTNLYNDNELHYSENIVFFVMQEVEKFILKPKSGEHKEKVCVECCKKYFNNDENLVLLVIKLLMPQLKQVKFSERQLRKIMRFFSRIL